MSRWQAGIRFRAAPVPDRIGQYGSVLDTIKKVLIAYLLLASAGLLAQIPTQDRVLMGAMSFPQYSLIAQIPLPQFSDQKFCSLVQLAPNVLTWAYVP